MKQNLFCTGLLLGLASLTFVACSDDNTEPGTPDTGFSNSSNKAGTANDMFTAEEWYPGGELGTTTNEVGCYSNEAPAVDNLGLETIFKYGEQFFERDFTYSVTDKAFGGLGPAAVRTGCMYCHPRYGHGTSRQQTMKSYKANDMGNGYLLVIYHPTAGTDALGKQYAANSYISEVTGMPQTLAQTPFLPPIDENQISIEWKHATDEHGNQFPDGEKYELKYPEVNIPVEAFNTNPKPSNYEVRLESTIGMYGTGLLDAIDTDDMKKVYQEESKYVELNPGMWDKAANDWASSAWYTLADGTKAVKKFTYAMTRASLQDGAGANAIWNITNVTRSDRHYLYTTTAWAKAMSENSDVISYIQKNGASESSAMHPYYADGTAEGIKNRVYDILSCNSNTANKETQAFENYLFKGAPYNGTEEMSDQNYYQFMVWHRGLAVPEARNLGDADVKLGKKLFMEIGCASCHKPSWKTGSDNYWACSIVKGQGKLPTYPNQTIYPYTDMVQHRLYMVNDIRTGWCRTTPLWGRGLSQQETGWEDRLHDCRAKNEIEAIMWHGYSKNSDAYKATQKFYNLSKTERDAIVKFLRSI